MYRSGDLAATRRIPDVDRLHQRLGIDARGQRTRESARLGHALASDVHVPGLARAAEEICDEVPISSDADGLMDARAIGDSVIGVRHHEHAADGHLRVLVVEIQRRTVIGTPRRLLLVEDAPR